MTIQKYTTDVELKVGQWINCEGMMYGSFAGKPCIIREIKKASVSTEICNRMRNSDEIDWEPKLFRASLAHPKGCKTSIRFVCDTEEEANIMRECSSQFNEFQFEKEREFKKQMQIEQYRFIHEAFAKAEALMASKVVDEKTS